MKKNCTLKLCLIIVSAVIMAGTVNAQTIDLENSVSFKDHNFLIVEQRFNNTPNKTLALATPDEPLFLAINNETIAISLAEWGDDSRYGVIVKISNRSYGVLMPLERGWGTQVDERTIGNLTFHIGLIEIFRGRNVEFARLGVFITKNQ